MHKRETKKITNEIVRTISIYNWKLKDRKIKKLKLLSLLFVFKVGACCCVCSLLLLVLVLFLFLFLLFNGHAVRCVVALCVCAPSCLIEIFLELNLWLKFYVFVPLGQIFSFFQQQQKWAVRLAWRLLLRQVEKQTKNWMSHPLGWSNEWMWILEKLEITLPCLFFSFSLTLNRMSEQPNPVWIDKCAPNYFSSRIFRLCEIQKIEHHFIFQATNPIIRLKTQMLIHFQAVKMWSFSVCVCALFRFRFGRMQS